MGLPNEGRRKMEIIMNVDKVTEDFLTIIVGECFYWDDKLFMKISNSQAFNFETDSAENFAAYDRVQWVKTKLLVG